jgi:BirA family transcriptional regulator, biotin operon repressor / biotin---[acetyl-CoA-carboxylase] ligase
MASFYFFDSLSSTMDEARSKAFQDGKEGDVIVAKHQTKGRGRRGRVWESLPGNLHLTYLTYLDIPLSEAPQLSLVACVALGEELLNWIPPTHNLTYKWPNDLLLNGKKVGGLLLEAIPHPEKKEVCYLIGCGLNLKSYPQKVRYPATSFEAEGTYFALDSIQKTLVTSLEHYLSLWRKKGFDYIHALWMKRAAYLDTFISVEIGDKVQDGIFKGIDEEGAMLLKTSDGTLKISVGEVL